MARARSLKPAFFKNEDLAALGFPAMLLYQGLWVLADREGRLEDRPMRIKAEVFPYSEINIENQLQMLASEEFIIRYEVKGKRYICIPTWSKHQNPHVKEVASTIPAPGQHRASTGFSRSSTGPAPEIPVQAPVSHSAKTPSSLTPLTLNPLPVVGVHVHDGQAPHPTEISDDDPIFPGCNVLPGSISKPYTDSGQALDQLARDLVNRLMARHWTASNAPVAIGRLERILAEAVHPERTAAAIEANHASWAAWHAANRKERKKRLEYWLADGDYLHPVSGYSAAPVVPVLDDAPVVDVELSDEEIARLDRERVQGKLQEALRA